MVTMTEADLMMIATAAGDGEALVMAEDRA